MDVTQQIGTGVEEGCWKGTSEVDPQMLLMRCPVQNAVSGQRVGELFCLFRERPHGTSKIGELAPGRQGVSVRECPPRAAWRHLVLFWSPLARDGVAQWRSPRWRGRRRGTRGGPRETVASFPARSLRRVARSCRTQVGETR